MRLRRTTKGTDCVEAAGLLRKIADARDDYVGGRSKEAISHEIEVMRNIADVLVGKVSWSDFISCYAPSYHWGEFGEHNPMLDANINSAL